MSAGYGRGFYGEEQLARPPRRKRNWFTIVAVLGLGAGAVWLLWPRKSFDLGPAGKEPEPSQPQQSLQQQSPLVIINTAAPAAPAPVVGAFLKQLEDDTRLRGFASVKDYEDSIVASAKQLQAVGAQVALAPHLQHLAPRLA